MCCRQEEFQQADEKLLGLNGAVYLEPLSDDQIQAYLQAVQRPQLWEKIPTTDLRHLLPDWDRRDQAGQLPGLRSPLLLNILLVAYQGQTIRNQSELFAAYIQEQFRQYRTQHGTPPYTETQTRRYLTWLARQLKAENTTEFEIEALQPTWLEHRWQRWLYRLIFGLIFGLFFSLIVGLIVIPTGAMLFESFREMSTFSNSLIISGLVGLIIGLGGAIYFGILEELKIIKTPIKTTDSFDFSSNNTRNSIFFGLANGLFSGLCFWAILPIHWSIDKLTLALIGLILGGVYGLIFELINKNNDIRPSKNPNQRIFNSVRNSIFIMIVTSPVGVLIFKILQLETGQLVEPQKFLLPALTGGIFFSIDIIRELLRYGALRLQLWCLKFAPWNYADFLGYASELRLVQRIGGRYRFLHDLLREHIIDQAPLSQRSAAISIWITISGLFIGLLAAISAGFGTKPVSPDLASITAPTLRAGDWVFINHSYLFSSPQRGQLVACRWMCSALWVIGMPSDTISSSRGQLLVNGKPINKHYAPFPLDFPMSNSFQVPKNCYLITGKKVLKDGTVEPTGRIVPRQELLGQYVWRVWPPHRFGAVR